LATLTCIGGESVDENFAERALVYPNPCKNSFTIEADEYSNYKLYNSIGQLIQSGSCQGKTEIDTHCLLQGIYFLVLNGESGNRVEKLVIEK
jgi:hypothetical protein